MESAVDSQESQHHASMPAFLPSEANANDTAIFKTAQPLSLLSPEVMRSLQTETKRPSLNQGS